MTPGMWLSVIVVVLAANAAFWLAYIIPLVMRLQSQARQEGIKAGQWRRLAMQLMEERRAQLSFGNHSTLD